MMLDAVWNLVTTSLAGRTLIAYLLVVTVPAILPIIFFRLVGLRGLKTLLSYESHHTFVHDIDPRLKVLYPVTVGVLSIFLSWDWVFFLLALTLVPWIVVRPSKERSKLLLTMAIIPAITNVWSQGLYHTSSHHLLVAFPWTVSWTGTPGLSTFGLQYGVQETGRLMVSVFSSLLLIMTTTPSDIVWALRKFGMPQRAGLSLSVALRYLPQMFERLNTLLQSVRVRGYDFSRPAKWYYIKQWTQYAYRMLRLLPMLAVPLMIGSLGQVSILATVADARAFNVQPRRGTYREHQLTPRDRMAWGYYGLMIAAVMAVVVTGVGIRSGIN